MAKDNNELPDESIFFFYNSQGQKVLKFIEELVHMKEWHEHPAERKKELCKEYAALQEHTRWMAEIQRDLENADWEKAEVKKLEEKLASIALIPDKLKFLYRHQADRSHLNDRMHMHIISEFLEREIGYYERLHKIGKEVDEDGLGSNISDGGRQGTNRQIALIFYFLRESGAMRGWPSNNQIGILLEVITGKSSGTIRKFFSNPFKTSGKDEIQSIQILIKELIYVKSVLEPLEFPNVSELIDEQIEKYSKLKLAVQSEE